VTNAPGQGTRIAEVGSDRDSDAVMARASSRLAWAVWILGLVAMMSGITLGVVNGSADGLSAISQVAAFFAVGVVGLVVAHRQPRNPLGWIYLVVWMGAGVMFSLMPEYARWAVATHPAGPAGTFAEWLGHWIWVPIFVPLTTFPFLLFPDGHLASGRWRPVPWLIATTTVLWSISFALSGVEYTDALGRPAPNPYAPKDLVPFFDVSKNVLGIAFVVLVGLCVASLIVRFRGGDHEQREQIKWLMFAGAVMTTWFMLPLEHGGGGPVDFIQGFVIALIPISTGIAILKYRLYDIDVVINKTVVYGALALLITAVYVAIVVGVGYLVGAVGSPALSALAAAVIALAFQPARRRVQRFANRIVYGKRATPYEVLSEFADRLSESYSVDDVLPRLTRLVADGTGALDVRVWLRVGAELRPTTAWPADTSAASPVDDVADLPGRAFEVLHQGVGLGAITLVMPPSEPMTPEQERLVTDVASQAGLVLRNVALLEDLRASRRRIVAAQDERAKALERNIHDGAQQQLVALSVKLRLAQQLAERDQAKANEMLVELQADATDALENLRDLARGIYPPLLADKGLVTALEGQARKAAFEVTVEPDGVGRYPQDIEAAVYFCALEALNNVAKYAQASSAQIRLNASGGSLAFEVTDDGVGFDPAETGYGTGVQGMADRLEALGGEIEVRSAPGEGTTIRGRIPVERTP
jgi:signal transduction histidine kinase